MSSSKTELSNILKELKKLNMKIAENAEKLDVLRPLVSDTSKKLDSILNTAGSKKPIPFKKSKSVTKSINEQKCFNIIVFFRHFYPIDEKKFDSLWEEGEKKALLDKHAKEWEGKNEADVKKIQMNILYKNLSKASKAKLQIMKKTALGEYKMNARKSEDRAEEDSSDTDK